MSLSLSLFTAAPRLERGDVVFARVCRAGAGGVGLACVAGAEFKARGLGVLRGGVVVRGVPPAATARLVAEARGGGSATGSILAALAKDFAFEVAVGDNGRLWLEATVPGDNHARVVALVSALQAWWTAL